jgi:hypothetical protein
MLKSGLGLTHTLSPPSLPPSLSRWCCCRMMRESSSAEPAVQDAPKLEAWGSMNTIPSPSTIPMSGEADFASPLESVPTITGERIPPPISKAGRQAGRQAVRWLGADSIPWLHTLKSIYTRLHTRARAPTHALSLSSLSLSLSCLDRTQPTQCLRRSNRLLLFAELPMATLVSTETHGSVPWDEDTLDEPVITTIVRRPARTHTHTHHRSPGSPHALHVLVVQSLDAVWSDSGLLTASGIYRGDLCAETRPQERRVEVSVRSRASQKQAVASRLGPVGAAHPDHDPRFVSLDSTGHARQPLARLMPHTHPNTR